jgi:putative hydrolase of the HAD superfamily
MENGIKGIFFDYSGLLFDCVFDENRTLKRAHEHTLKVLKSNKDNLTFKELKEASYNSFLEYLDYRKQEINGEWALEEIMKRTLNRLNIPLNEELLKQITHIYKIENHDTIPRKGVFTVIPSLSEDYKLGIISNTTHDSLKYELKENDLLQYFDNIILSYEVGKRKPDKIIYETALKKANLNSEESLFVSHDMEEIEGAIKVGMKTLLIDTKNGGSLEELIK